MAIIVDAKNDTVKEFYERYGFIRFHKQSNKLLLPLDTVVKAFK